MDSDQENFGFGFNDRKFSDRLLRIEIMGWPSDSSSNSEGCKSVTDWNHPTKRRRKNINNEIVTNSDIVACADRQNLTDEEPDMVGCSGSERLDDEGESIVEEALSEVAAFMELLKFIYSNVVSVDTVSAILDVMIAADKYEVASCMSYCIKLIMVADEFEVASCMSFYSKLLQNLPMTCEFALFYLQLPSSVLKSKSVQPLTDAAKQFLATHYKDITKYSEEVMSLPLAGIEAVLSNDDLQIESEDAVYDFIINWARVHYPLMEERREILGSRLARTLGQK